MKTRLTLVIDEKVIESAKRYAQKNGRSVSHLVENYLKSITAKKIKEEVISQKVLKLMGVIKLSKDYNYKARLGNALKKQ